MKKTKSDVCSHIQSYASLKLGTGKGDNQPDILDLSFFSIIFILFSVCKTNSKVNNKRVVTLIIQEKSYFFDFRNEPAENTLYLRVPTIDFIIYDKNRLVPTINVAFLLLVRVLLDLQETINS